MPERILGPVPYPVNVGNPPPQRRWASISPKRPYASAMVNRLAMLLVLLMAQPALGASTVGSPTAPLDLPASRPGPDELKGPSAVRLSKAFDRALAALDGQRWADAAEGFEALLGEVDWPEAAFDAALARYQLLDLGRARSHAAAAAQGLPRDAQARWLHAVVLSAVGRHADAGGEAARAVELARENGDRPLLARSLLQVSSAARLSGRYGASTVAALEARDLAEASEDPELEAAAWVAIGQAALSRGDEAGAAQAFAQAGGRAASAIQQELALAAAEEAWRRGDADGSVVALSAALVEIDSDPQIPALGRAAMMARAAPLLWLTGDRTAAAIRLDAAEAVLRPAGALAAVADIEVVRASWAVAGGSFEQARTLLDSATTAMEGLQVPVALASAQLARAQLLAEDGDVRGAIALAEQAKEVFESTEYAEGRPGAWLVLAELLGRGGALADAHAAGLRAVELALERSNARQEAAARAEVAVILARLGALSEAASEYESATSAGALLSTRARVRLDVELGRANARADRLQEGLTHARRALAEAGEGSDAPKDLVALAEEAVTAVLLEGGRHDEAESFVAERGIVDERIVAAVNDRQGTALYNEGVDAYAAGDYATAIDRFATVAGAAASTDERRLRARKATQRAFEARGVEHLEAGRVKDADSDLAQAASIAAEVQDPGAQARATLQRAQIALDAGHPERAADLGSRAALAAPSGSVRRAEAWELVGLARIDDDPQGARRAFEDALLAWGDRAESVARRATLTYNLAVLEQTGDETALIARLNEVSALAVQAGDDALRDEVQEWLKQLETSE